MNCLELRVRIVALKLPLCCRANLLSASNAYLRHSEAFGKNKHKFDARAEVPWLNKRFEAAS